MIIRNLGQIFNLSDYPQFSDYTHAQSPQAIQVGNAIRVYFSTRKYINNENEPVSEVHFADFNSSFTDVLRVSTRPVINLGEKGTFDEHGIFPFHPFQTGGHLYGFTSGWSRRKSVPVETSIGLSESRDGGNTYVRLGKGPVLTSSRNEPFLVGDPWVIEHENQFYMYYIAGEKWSYFDSNFPERVYKIRLATSVDLINWKPFGTNIIDSRLGTDECQALPSVSAQRNKLMVYCYRDATRFRTERSRSYRLGFSISKDLVSWQNIDDIMPREDWDSEMQCYPSFFETKSKQYILYNGNNFGKLGFGIGLIEYRK